jgi:DNA polymerase-3 subunit epsilon
VNSLTNADQIAGLDVETTGLFPWRHDRIIEIAIVLMSPDGTIHAEYETLVNPVRDIGPTRIHQISAGEVLGAPKFEDIAGDIVEMLATARIVAGHNISFDRNFLINEYERLGVVFPELTELCTYQLLGRTNLASCCREFDVDFEGMQHRAISDARATAQLVRALIEGHPALVREFESRGTAWPQIRPLKTPPVTRDQARAAFYEPPKFLQRVLNQVRHETEADSPSVLAYQGLIDRVLEDRTIDAGEEEALIEAVAQLGLSPSQVRSVHKEYIQSLVVHALADGRISQAERADLDQVARLLGQDDIEHVIRGVGEQLRTGSATGTTTTASNELFGKRVCFTGELMSEIDGRPITREMAHVLAEQHGMVVASNVSKKLDVLVVADPNSQSGKARKARNYGVRILAEPAFWNAIGVMVS